MAGFDHKCPFCDHEIEVYKEWEFRDYTTNFEVACEWCKRQVSVNVRSEPIFETCKPTCAMCGRADTGDNPNYCNPCHQKLIELSKHNGETTLR
jgi:hypothetical protein